MSFATLQQFTESLRRLPRVVAQRVAEAAADKITDLGLSTFDRSQDAYGAAWIPGHEGQTVDLVESGRLRAYLKYKAIGTKLRSVLGTAYAKYQIGRRPVYPRGALPASYVRELQRTAVDVCKAEMGGSS